jgi:hypothetical protein
MTIHDTSRGARAGERREGDLARLDQDGTSVVCSHRWRDGVVCPELVAERFYIVAQSRERWPLTMEPEDWRAPILRFPPSTAPAPRPPAPVAPPAGRRGPRRLAADDPWRHSPVGQARCA